MKTTNFTICLTVMKRERHLIPLKKHILMAEKIFVKTDEAKQNVHGYKFLSYKKEIVAGKRNKNWNKELIFQPLFIYGGQYLCMIELGYGADVVFDLIDKTYYKSYSGVVTEYFVFTSHYHRFPSGAFFERAV